MRPFSLPILVLLLGALLGVVGESSAQGYPAKPMRLIVGFAPGVVVAKLNADINAALKSPDLAQRWETLGVLPLGGTPEDAAQRNRMETER